MSVTYEKEFNFSPVNASTDCQDMEWLSLNQFYMLAEDTRKANQFAHNDLGEEINKKRETKGLGIETDSRTRHATMDWFWTVTLLI